MASKVFAFTAAFDQAFVLRHDLERILGKDLRLMMFTDSKQLFDVITKSSHASEKRLMIEITAARQVYERHEISNVGLVAGTENPADELTKPGRCTPLETLMKTGIDQTAASQ